MTELAHELETELPQEKLIRRLCTLLGVYLSAGQIREVRHAYEFGAEAHSGQFRLSGEPYICHPLSVAIILAEMRMDAKGIMAAILHDAIEDTPVTKEQLKEAFGEEVAELVDGVSKLTQIDCKSRAEARAENVRKMFLAMAKDLRVIMVKLADRLHNMRTLGVMSAERRRRIARETLDIYAPLANRLGMNQLRLELEDLGLAALHPVRYRILDRAVKRARGHRKEVVATIQAAIENRLAEAGLQCEVIGREKHLYSLYRKMRGKRVSFNEVFDLYAMRIIAERADDCYRVLGLVHNLYKPIPGRFKDYIALPKANGYQSLHTVLVGPYGLPVEVQIRARDMHRMAEAGIAAHWLYKAENEPDPNAQARIHEWLRDLLEIQKSAGDSLEFIDNLKIDLFRHEIYVFTPRGSIIKLPAGATIVDFAYAVHTDIGNSCVAARVDRRLSPLQTKLANGQTVEAITAPWARPNPVWLNYVVTAKARAGIRTYLRNFKKQEAIRLGRRLLEKELNALGARLDAMPESRIAELLREMESTSLNGLLEAIGLGNRMPFIVAKRLCQEDIKAGLKLNESEKASFAPLIIKGTEGMVVSLAKCCRPIPGDLIIGYFNPGKGIVVHRTECKNAAEFRKKNTSWLDVEWDEEVSREFPAEVRIELLNQRGTLAKVASTISSMESNIENVLVANQDEQTSTDLITFTVKNRVHLANVMRQLRKLPVVLRVYRVKA